MLSAKEALEQKQEYERDQQIYQKVLDYVVKSDRKIYYSPFTLDSVLESIHNNVKEGFIEIYGLLKKDVVESLKNLGYKVFYQCFIYRDVRPNVVNGRREYEFLKNYKWYTKVFWDDSLIEQKVKCCNYWEQL